MINYEFFINIAVIVLLVPTIVYLCKVNKKLKILKKNQKQLSILVQSLDDASSKAENMIPLLKSTAAQSVDKARQTKEDIEFLIKKAEELTNKLENGIYISKQKNEAFVAKENIDDEHSEAEIELLHALRAIR